MLVLLLNNEITLRNTSTGQYEFIVDTLILKELYLSNVPYSTFSSYGHGSSNNDI